MTARRLPRRTLLRALCLGAAAVPAALAADPARAAAPGRPPARTPATLSAPRPRTHAHLIGVL
ncbi:hypothetical protein ACGFI9_11970 [Micromonospora sp. NPDC048930]|uniref:hypothetical protein n=1 Tax=Micromonospora sp. NPDC048930 TaxID=3364261 RepID=UPI00371D49D5